MDAYVDGLANICGQENVVAEAMGQRGPFYLPQSGVNFERIESCFATALHMHQPLIPAGGDELTSAKIISNLEQMLNSPRSEDSYNATVFLDCYRRMGKFITELVIEGAQPRVMLDYSGCLLDGLCIMKADDVIESLREITCEKQFRGCIEWLGSAWGHPVAPSTPVQDYRLGVRAWQHFFAAIFGVDALARVRGFSPSEMALPNQPDVCYEFVKTLKECGYRWVLVQEHTIERADGGAVVYPHRPHRLVAKNSLGQSVSITAIIKTQGSDTKLVGQMQQYYEAMNLRRWESGGKTAPAVVTQIADGENGGVMMNEFPPKFLEVMLEASGTATAPVNITEYLEYLDSIGISEDEFPAVQPVMQKRIWERFEDGSGPEAMQETIEQLKKQDDRFNMEGGSWTGNISWVRGYEGVLGPMQKASAMFAEKALAQTVATSEGRYRRALYHLLISQTSCFRYWGEGMWTDYGRELCRRAMEILEQEF